jgi:CRISPR system Cascade subunit CasE
VTLHMIQLTPDVPRLIRWAEAQRLLATRQEDDLGYALHAMLRAAFDTLAPSPFAMIPQGARPAQLLAYSACAAPILREQAQTFAEPEIVEIIGLAGMADKQMPDRIVAGRRLGFMLRVRPTIRTDLDGDRTRTRERDAFLASITGTEPGTGPSRGEVYQHWLTTRLRAGGAEPEHLVLEGFRLTTTLRRDRMRKLHPLSGPDASFTGVLTVTDPDRFAALLARGVGRHAAFGFGMLLLKPDSLERSALRPRGPIGG